ncbi:MmgE/PrpD family protein [Planococcus glaciei]|uniref:MmgE/PrpD family protein n=1 Tax=Planococcus glaciei TaxID=459472 RepID=A0A7H8Q7N5_9BACL|nr:MmgE/PrpD family protein [Planococcus glaciei]QDY44817.1 MmgE/PrpD family protein [Planococcus glaciei]QKX49531.1 MmgE/PrpD family protein [Planococcus glaciei]
MTQAFMKKMAAYIHGASYSSLSEEMIRLSKLAILDTVGVALAGGREASVQKVHAVFAGRKAGGEQATVWMTDEKILLEYAALINGTATHALDYDDVAPSILAHPSAPVTAAILPFAEHAGESGEDVIVAYVIGTEVMTKLGKAMGFKHYDLGWHATSTLGTVGAAAACAYLAGFSEEQIANALAISASMSSGLQKNFGTMTKPLHAGLAAQYAIQSVLLAAEGFEANPDVFEARGFFEAFTGQETAADFQQELEGITFGGLHDYEEHGLSVKKYPCCYFMHRFISGVLEAREEVPITLETLEEIEVTVPPGGLTALIHHQPATGLQGKFSAEYACLAALKDGVVQLQSFTDEQVMRGNIQKNLFRVKAKEEAGDIRDSQEIETLPVLIKITDRAGHSVEKEILHAPGSKGKPMTVDEHRKKWVECLSYISTEKLDQRQMENAHELFEQGLGLEAFERIGEWLSGVSGFCSKENERVMP